MGYSASHMHTAARNMEMEVIGTGLSCDEQELVDAYRRAKKLKYADILVSVQEGIRVKLWLTEKMK